jgi:hypothetical protein
MSRAAVSVLVFGLYLAGGGLLLLLVPGMLCRVLHLRPPGQTMWVRLSGMFFLFLAFYCVQAARAEDRAFFRWSTRTRPWTALFLGAFVAVGLENPTVLLFGVVDLLASSWTALALRDDPRPEGRRSCTGPRTEG